MLQAKKNVSLEIRRQTISIKCVIYSSRVTYRNAQKEMLL